MVVVDFHLDDRRRNGNRRSPNRVSPAKVPSGLLLSARGGLWPVRLPFVRAGEIATKRSKFSLRFAERV